MLYIDNVLPMLESRWDYAEWKHTILFIAKVFRFQDLVLRPPTAAEEADPAWKRDAAALTSFLSTKMSEDMHDEFACRQKIVTDLIRTTSSPLWAT